MEKEIDDCRQMDGWDEQCQVSYKMAVILDSARLYFPHAVHVVAEFVSGSSVSVF